MVYVREIEDTELEFGVLGVRKDSLILYDQETRSQWTQLGGEAVEGSLKGKRLETLPSALMSWSQWKKLHPETTVYIRKLFPYRSRFTTRDIGQFAGQRGSGADSADLILAVRGRSGEFRAYSLKLIADKGLINDDLEGLPILLHYSRQLQTVQAMSRLVEDQALTFNFSGEGELIDLETGSTWSPETMVAVAGKLAGKKLRIIPSSFSRWSAWRQYRPDTRLVTGD